MQLLISLPDDFGAFTLFRFMIRCVGCQEWFHGNCVGISEAGGCKDFVCPACVTKNQSEQQPQPEAEGSLPQGSTQSQDEDTEGKSEQQAMEVRPAFGR